MGPLSRDRPHETGVGAGVPRFPFAFACKLLHRKRNTHGLRLFSTVSDKVGYEHLR